MTTLGHYKLHEEVGRGNFSSVFRATHGALGNQVAIKVLASELSQNEDARALFLEEAQKTSLLDHPNIVKVVDLDEEGNQVFIAMEYISGSDLRKRLAEPTPLPQSNFLMILQQIAEALDFAHSHGVFHCDVKPGNILLADDGTAHLVDFGFAKIAEVAQSSHPGSVVGTAAYISPEVAEGKQPGSLADQYSLVAMTYEYFAGSMPFIGDSSTAIALQHVTRQPPDPREFNPELGDEVSQVLLRGLAKEPAQRFTSCLEFVKNLSTALEESQNRQCQMLLAEARQLLEAGKVTETFSKLESVRKLFIERPELTNALAELEAATELAQKYEQMVQDWETANIKAREVLENFPEYPDPQGIFVELGLRKQGWKLPATRELVLQIGLGLIIGLPLAGLIIAIAFRWITR